MTTSYFWNPKLRDVHARPIHPWFDYLKELLISLMFVSLNRFPNQHFPYLVRNTTKSLKRSNVKKGWLNGDHKVKKMIHTHIRARSTIVVTREGMKSGQNHWGFHSRQQSGERSFSSFFWSASDRRSDGHESPECSTTLNHRLPDVGHQFSTPHSVSNCSKSPKYESGCHPDAKSKSKAHLRPVPARGTLLTVRLRGKRHCLS